MGSSLFPEYNMEKNPYIKLKFGKYFPQIKNPVEKK